MKNIVEILKNCPKGTKLYSPACGECKYIKIENNFIVVEDCDDYIHAFYSDGRRYVYGECILFPSKDNKDWDKFQRPFQDGDVITCTNSACSFVAIFKEMNTNTSFRRYVSLTLDDDPQFWIKESWSDFKNSRFATEEEKQKLFDAIKANGYKWNAETKTLEKLIEPKFKVGDRIVKRNSKNNPWIISSVNSEYYELKLHKDSESIGVILVSEQDDYELVPVVSKFKVGDRVKHISDHTPGIVIKVDDTGYYIDYPKGNGVRYISFTLEKDYELLPNKFDISTLKPFESRVLVRDVDHYEWEGAIFGRYDGKNFFTIGGLDWGCCIPYEGNEHLLGTTNDCDEYYKNW